ncbi:MAG: hypothetical protein Q7W45_06480 [Bacteroidota bacterium]|nr:hypothetical protein [Bacteroidota bacterium]MDP3145094.1 hypothetical protein [Bacteroidota bacterium]
MKIIKKLLIIVLTLFLLTNCKQYIQVFDTASKTVKISDTLAIFETDSVKISYTFWSDKGLMSFSIFNKLDKPIYIDWKSCAFIDNGNKLNYWDDGQLTITDMKSRYGSYFYSGPLLEPGFTLNKGVQITTSTSKVIKPERITFIPPKSNYTRTQFYLMPNRNFYSIDRKVATKTKVKRNDKPRKKTDIHELKYDYNNSPFKIRNYLAFSLSENSSNFFYVDNEFFLTSVKEMDYRHYQGRHVMDNGKISKKEWMPFTKPSSFFLKLEGVDNIESR